MITYILMVAALLYPVALVVYLRYHIPPHELDIPKEKLPDYEDDY